MNPIYQMVPNPTFHTPNPEYQSSPDPAYQSPQLPPRKEDVRPSVHVSQYSSTSIYKPAYAEITEVGGSKPQPRRRRVRFAWHFFSHLVSVLWLAPIGTLLFLNYQRHIIGASVWCPGGRCSAEVFSTDSGDYIQRANKLDRDDHNTLGALQFVAKGLEVWFMLIATALVYDVAMVFARRGGGLPLGYLLTHLEFTDIRNLFSRLMWTSPIPHANTWSSRQHLRTLTLYLFAILATFLTILTNLMGPATAVLVLPTLQWIDTPHVGDQIFNGTGAAYLPGGDGNSFPGCDNDTLTARTYSCSEDVFGPSLDAWATSAAANVKQASQWEEGVNLGVSQEGRFDFTLNVSFSSPIVWVPNRQVLNWLSIDWGYLMGDLAEGSKGVKYNNSLTTVMQRTGPSVGLNMNYNVGNWTPYTTNDNRELECFSGWTIDFENYYTKCIPSGPGWNILNDWANFSLENPAPNEKNINVLSLFSEKSVYFSDTDDFGSGIKSCIDHHLTDCDWDKIFDTEPPQDLRNTSVNVGVTVYDSHMPGKPSHRVVWCDQVAYLGFPTYQIDLSPSSASHQLSLIQLNNISNAPLPNSSLAVDPRWLVAAWTVDVGGIVNGSRAMAKELTRVLPSLLTTPWTANFTEAQREFIFLHTYCIGQAMSMVNYYYINATMADSSVHADHDHPYLYHFNTLHVWAFGLSGRTSRLGVAVVLAGSFCVLVRLVLGCAMLRHEHSPVELFVAAFEHQHQQEFGGLHHEGDWAKVRYRMDVGHHGKPTFHPDRSSGGSP